MADQTLARYVNELSVLTMLRTGGPSSRADLARRLSLTPPTLTRLISELTSRGLVEETAPQLAKGALREAGRPAINVALRPSGAYFLGVEIGVRIVRFALIDLLATPVAFSNRHPLENTPEIVTDLIAKELAIFEADARFSGRIQTIGLTVPGLVQTDGYVVHLPVSGWKNVDLAEMLGRTVHLPCSIENNANAAAFGAIYSQPSIPSTCTLFLKLGTGCGGAAIINGRIMRGGYGTAGEFGHIRVTARGRRCYCGQIGCLESWVNLGAMYEAWQGKLPGEKDLSDLPEKLLCAEVEGDESAKSALKSLAVHLSSGIVSLVNIFNPTTIVLGGVMKPLLQSRLSEIRTRVSQGIVQGTNVPDILVSSLDEYECAIGAASLAHHHAFDISTVELSGLERN